MGATLPPSVHSQQGEEGCWTQGLWGLNPGGLLELTARWGCRNALSSWGASRGSTSGLNGHISSLDAGGPHPKWKTSRAGTGIPEASRGSKVNSFKPMLYSYYWSSIPPLWPLPVLLGGNRGRAQMAGWESPGRGEDGMIYRRQESAKGPS